MTTEIAVVTVVGIGAVASVLWKFIDEHYAHKSFALTNQQNQIWYLLQMLMGSVGIDLEVMESEDNETKV